MDQLHPLLYEVIQEAYCKSYVRPEDDDDQ